LSRKLLPIVGAVIGSIIPGFGTAIGSAIGSTATAGLGMAAGGLAGSLLSSGIGALKKPKAQQAVAPAAAPAMPFADDAKVQAAKRRELFEIGARSGRASTMLTSDKKLERANPGAAKLGGY
jgi:hypothetical protein